MSDYFKKPSFGGGRPRPSFGPKRPGGNFRPQGNRQFGGELHDADCNSCGKPCQVPFRPNGKKPIYCRDCFKPADDRGNSFEKPRREFATRAAAPVADKRIDSVLQQLDALNRSVEALSFEVQKITRGDELRAEVRKLVPEAKPAAKKAAPKKATTKAASKASKKK